MRDLEDGAIFSQNTARRVFHQFEELLLLSIYTCIEPAFVLVVVLNVLNTTLSEGRFSKVTLAFIKLLSLLPFGRLYLIVKVNYYPGLSHMDENAEVEQLARDMAGVKVQLFTESAAKITAELDFLVWVHRRLIQEYQDTHSIAERDSEYGDLALSLAWFLAIRFYLGRIKESSDLQEAKELERIISCYNHNIHNESQDDCEKWNMYQGITARTDLMVQFQEMEARLTQLQIHQVAQSLLSSHQIGILASLMDDKAEPEQVAKDMASVKVRLFRNSNDDPTRYDGFILYHRWLIHMFRHPLRLVEQDKALYGRIALHLAVNLAFRFSTARRKEESDLQESKELEIIICRNNRDINNKIHGDYYEWLKYKWLIARADLIVAFEKLEARLAQLQAHQARPLYSLQQTETSALLTKLPVATLEPDSRVPCLSSPMDSLVAITITGTGHNLLPSASQLNPSHPTSLPSIPSGERAAMESWTKALLDASDETEIRDYAIYCQVLAQLHFSRYRTAKDALDLEEAAEHSVTAYQLFADLADASLSLKSRTMAILLAYLAEHLGDFPQVPSINVLETFKELVDNFPETAVPPETSTLTLPPTKSPPEIMETDSDLLRVPSLPRLDSSKPPFASPRNVSSNKTLMELALSALRDAHDETDIVAYAAYCQVLAHCHFSRYQAEKHILDLEEAAEYSAAACRLFADTAYFGLMLPKTRAIFLTYLAEHSGGFPPLPSTNVLETFKEFRDNFSETTQSSGSSHQDETSTFPPSVPNRKSAALKLAMSALHDANDKTDIIDYATYCHVLAHFPFSRYRSKRNILDLEEAAEYSVTATWLFADAAPVFLTVILPRAIAILNEYLDVYSRRPADFPHLPSMNVLEALDLLLEDVGPLEPYEWRLNLGYIFYRVHSRTQDPQHAEMAITQYQKAFECQPPTIDSRKSVPCHHWFAHIYLAFMLIDRYERSGDFGDLDIALNNLRLAEAQKYGVDYHGQLPYDQVIEAFLGMAFWHRFLGQPGARLPSEDKEQAISYYSQAHEHDEDQYNKHNDQPHEHDDQPHEQDDQSHEQDDQSSGQGFLRHLLPARSFSGEQLQHDSVPRRDVLLELADAYIHRRAEGDKVLSFQCFERVAEEDRRLRDTPGVGEYNSKIFPKTLEEWKPYATRPFQSPSDQFNDAYGWGNWALEQDHPDCVEAFTLAASVLPELAGIGNKIEDVHRKLQETRNFAPCAAAAAVKFRTASLAVEWLELGMSVTTRQIYHLRLDVGDLATRFGDPDLFGNLRTLSAGLRQLSEEPVPTSGPSAFVGTIKGKVRLAYEAHREEVRRKPGMENFLRPLRFPQLAEAARHGPVILLSCDRVTDKAYAFIVLDPSLPEPITVPLPNTSFQDLTGLGEKFLRIRVDLLISLRGHHRSPEDIERQPERAGRVVTRNRDTINQEFEKLLKKLWTSIVEPVFDVLGKNNVKSGRVWWCPVGRLNGFPFHATVPIDCPYISSYTYGLEVLLNARARLGNTHSEQSRSQFSVVGIGKYPGRPHLALPSVAREVQIVSDLVGDNSGITIRKMENDEASVDSVLSALKSSQFIHLACHGTMDREDPLDSHLVLTDGQLGLRRIFAEDLTSAQFAFLSACQTAVGASELTDEFVHLTGGFVAAGFKGVIGTLWSINDDDAPQVVKDVYGVMKTEGGLDITMAADGLDWAVKRMRKAGVPPHRWVPFIHVGV
ncbi:hypothetical protein NP233_g8829 [Leucocoprinus birnbaumii]|uniref:CHAT domain-containing protein n=1 Tax=Leucocoprinus birnbaumii TaxID=56174 RepID=A0AAD5YRG7_9AGAR|nr:hypothetical protein NP233_g8829 [Leucocoprinus birnbaumii]